jgi:MFS superfamily sulfate permease-like transporter
MKHGDLAVYVVTAVSVVFVNLLHGVMIGLALAIALTGWRVLRARVEAQPLGEEWRVAVEAACTFPALPRLTHVLASIPAGRNVTVAIWSTTSITPLSSDYRLAATAQSHGWHGSDPGCGRDGPTRLPDHERPYRTRKARSRRLARANERTQEFRKKLAKIWQAVCGSLSSEP